MVKNKGGGNKAKKMGRKFQGQNIPGMVKTRFSAEAAEVYACVNKMLGNATCLVVCIDGKERLCVIRNKFKGRGKRHNMLSPGVWILVGLREFETASVGKHPKCDLLEVYGREDIKKIKQKELKHIDNWVLFDKIGSKHDQSSHDGDNLEFGDGGDNLDFEDDQETTGNNKQDEPYMPPIYMSDDSDDENEDKEPTEPSDEEPSDEEPSDEEDEEEPPAAYDFSQYAKKMNEDEVDIDDI